ncbi:MAG: VPLPA-CTERM sorting domain-containing protein [Pseudomonadota bacterium]
MSRNVPFAQLTHLKIKTIAHATGPMADRSFDAIVVEGLDTVEIQDVDSNAGQDFTDVAGVNLQVASYGDALEAGGFDFVGPPLEGFNYARAAQPDGQGWRNVGNTRNGAAYTVSYLADGGISEFEFVWGSNGPKRSDGAVRGWDIAFSASSAVVPLPAGVLLALSGFGALGVLQAWKRRRSA